MFRTIIWMIYFWIYQISMLGDLGSVRQFKRMGEHKIAQEKVDRVVKKWARALVKLAGATVNITGEENIPTENAVYIGNHQGNFDVPLMLGYIGKPRGFLSKIEMDNMPMVSAWMTQLGCIYVDRGDAKQSLKAVLEAIKYVKAGNSLTIFPEGTRSKSDKMGEFKAGGTRIAIKANALIVPVTIDGSYKLLEKNAGFKITPATVNLTVHTPINPQDLSKDELENIDDIIKNIIASKLPNQN